MSGVDAGKVTLRFEVDLEQFNRGLDAVKAKLQGIEPSATSAGGALAKTGAEATTAAVKFQTLTQGALNLTTSFAQAYTSISNLQRAKTSLQASAVSLERAEDQLARKRFKLNAEMEKAKPNLEKIALLTNEIATAEDDLSVKSQRLKDEQDRVNDTYLLFGLNLTNVAFSAIQTGKVMIDLAKGTKLLNVEVAITNVLTSKWTLIALTAIAAWEGIATILKSVNNEWGENMSIVSNVNKIMNDFSHASDVTVKNYGKNMAEMGDLSQGFADKQATAFESSNIRFNRWALERYAKLQMLIDQQDRLNASVGALSATGFR